MSLITVQGFYECLENIFQNSSERWLLTYENILVYYEISVDSGEIIAKSFKKISWQCSVERILLYLQENETTLFLSFELSLALVMTVKDNRFAQVFSACNFIQKEALAQMFSCKFCEISKNTFFEQHLRKFKQKFKMSTRKKLMS